MNLCICQISVDLGRFDPKLASEKVYAMPGMHKFFQSDMSYNLNSLKGLIWGIVYGTITGLIKGDTRSLDYSSYEKMKRFPVLRKTAAIATAVESKEPHSLLPTALWLLNARFVWILIAASACLRVSFHNG